jgi:hypothetical protein
MDPGWSASGNESYEAHDPCPLRRSRTTTPQQQQPMNAIATTTQQTDSGEMYAKIGDPITAIEKMGEWIASSGMLGCTKVEQGKLIAWQCAAEKKTPFDFKREYHIIGGSLSMRSDAMLAGYRARGGKVIWKQFDTKAAIAVWKYDGNECEIGFSTEDAKLAGLLPAKPGSGWAKDPGAMLRARCISKAIRMLAPEVVAGVYTPEETEDFQPAASEVAVTPTKAFDLVAKLEELFESREEDVNALLLKAGRIKEGQTFRDLDDAFASKYISKPDLILGKLPVIVTPETVVTPEVQP